MTGFKPGIWEKMVDVRDFIARNVTPYDGDEGFLAPPTERTKALWDEVAALMKEERDRGGVDVYKRQIPIGSSPLIGSSRRSRSGLPRIARASPSRCFIPRENCLNFLFLVSPRPTRRSASFTQSLPAIPRWSL